MKRPLPRYSSSDYFGFILSGEVELGKGKDPAADRVTFLVKSRSDQMRGSLGALGKGMMVGTSVFDDYLRATTARAVTPVTLAVVKKEEPPLAMELHRDAVPCALQVLRKLAALMVNYIDIVR